MPSCLYNDSDGPPSRDTDGSSRHSAEIISTVYMSGQEIVRLKWTSSRGYIQSVRRGCISVLLISKIRFLSQSGAPTSVPAPHSRKTLSNCRQGTNKNWKVNLWLSFFFPMDAFNMTAKTRTFWKLIEREIYVRTDVWDPYCNASCAKPAFLCVQVYSGDESEVIRSSAVNSWPSSSLTIEVVTITDICHSGVRHCSCRLSCKIVWWTLVTA